MIYVFNVFTTIFHIQMTSSRNRILRMEFSAVMIDGAFPCHHTNRSLYKHLSFVFYKIILEPSRTLVVREVSGRSPSFVTFVKSNVKALSTAVPSIKRCCCALRGFRLLQLYVFRYKLEQTSFLRV